MGRFKIYDSKHLLKIDNDSNFGKCLLCERKLKNIMGNIKRHYQQMHSMYIDANIHKTKKNRRKSLRAMEANIKRNHTNRKTTASAVMTSTIFEKSCDSLVSTSTLPITKSTKREFSIEENIKEMHFTTTPATFQQEQPINLLMERTLAQNDKSPVPQDSKVEVDVVSKTNITPKLPNPKKFKQNEESDENDEIKIPCYSYINNIQINSVTSIHQLEFLKCIVETRAQVNFPLKTFQQGDTFQKSLQAWKPNFQFNYSPQTVGEHIDRMTKKLNQEIKRIVANRLLYLKLDIASSREGNVMLVNIQFLNDFKVQIITLSLLELSDDDLASYLKKKVISTLERYKIDISFVYAIIKDNANNARKYHKTNENCTKTDILQVENSDKDTYYCQHLCLQFPGHAIHFVASDILKLLNENISQSRDSAKSLHRQMSQLKIKSKPVLDNSISWFSVYDMLESLINLREEIESNSLLVVEVDWIFTMKFVESFRPIVDTASTLQTTDIILPGDFYREWLLCEIKLEELATSNELALYLLQALQKRKIDFFENSSFLAALYLDPRFCYMGSMYLSDKEKEIAISHLLQIFNKLKTMHENISTHNSIQQMDERYSKLEYRIATILKANKEAMLDDASVSLNCISDQQVKEYLEQLQFEERLPFRTSVLEYWKMVRYKNPILAKIAEIALAVPSTQASISRALNVSSITLMKHKLNESTDNIENLLLLKLNQDLVSKITLEN